MFCAFVNDLPLYNIIYIFKDDGLTYIYVGLIWLSI